MQGGGVFEAAAPIAAKEATPIAAIVGAIRWVTKHVRSNQFEPRAKLIVRRVESVRDELEQLKSEAQQEN